MITVEEIKKTAKLARLSFSEEKMQEMAKDLNSIIKMIDQLKEVDCSDVEPLRSVSEAYQRLAEDEVTETDISEDLFKNIPENGAELAKAVKCFVVPKVVE
jgi:aspartyl-tRNA(Asn)/glutamyl-tRNA(Gln) amidotransferase subunit C